MSLPPALLQRLAQRGLVNKQKTANKLSEDAATTHAPAESEEVIAEDYDEMNENDQQTVSEEYQYPSQYDLEHESGGRKRSEDNYWLTQMRARMGEAGSAAGYKGCPNKYNVWHKCTLYCVNRWAEGISKPNADYMKRYKRLLRKYPLPNGWVEMYDPGCGCYYFACEADNVVSWLPPTHPKSVVTKCAALVRRQMDESTRDEDSSEDEESENDDDEKLESAQARHHREVEEIINASIKIAAKSSSHPNTRSSAVNVQEFPTLEQAVDTPTVALPRKQKSRDLDRALSKQKQSDRPKDERSRERDRDRYFSRHQARNKTVDHADPMDPSSYSDLPPGKWSDGLYTESNDRHYKKKSEETKTDKKDNDD